MGPNLAPKHQAPSLVPNLAHKPVPNLTRSSNLAPNLAPNLVPNVVQKPLPSLVLDLASYLILNLAPNLQNPVANLTLNLASSLAPNLPSNLVLNLVPNLATNPASNMVSAHSREEPVQECGADGAGERRVEPDEDPRRPEPGGAVRVGDASLSGPAVRWGGLQADADPLLADDRDQRLLLGRQFRQPGSHRRSVHDPTDRFRTVLALPAHDVVAGRERDRVVLIVHHLDLILDA